MADENSFESDWNLLAKVVKAGRAETRVLGADAMAQVFKAYKLGAEESRIEPHLTFTHDDITRLTADDVKKLLSFERIKSINGIERAHLQKRYDDLLAISDPNLATKAVIDELQRGPATHARVDDALKRVRESPSKQREAGDSDNDIKRQRRRE